MYANILVPIDGSDTSTRGLTEAIKIAKEQHARVRLVHVINELIMSAPHDAAFAVQLSDRLQEFGRTVLKEGEAKVRAAGIQVDSICDDVIGGQAGVQIVHHANAWPADLIVMGTHGRRGLRRIVMGSDAEYVVRHTPVPVLLIRGQAPPEE